MKINKFVLIVLGCFSFHSIHAVEEVVVTSAILSKSASKIPDPIHIVSGDDISTEATQSLGETLDDLWAYQPLITDLPSANLLLGVCQAQG